MYVRKYAHTHTCGCCSRLIMISPYLHLQWGDEKEVWLKIGWDRCGATAESISSSVGGMVRGQIQAVKQNFASSKCNEREIHSDLRLAYWRQVAIPSQQEIVWVTDFSRNRSLVWLCRISILWFMTQEGSYQLLQTVFRFKYMFQVKPCPSSVKHEIAVLFHFKLVSGFIPNMY